MPTDAYASFAAYYERAFAELLRPVRQRMVAQIAPGMRVLDLCCGAGGFLADLHRAGVRAIGVDLSPSMLCAASQPHACLIRADARVLPFANHAFDRVTLCLALHEMHPDCARAVLHESLRLSPRVILADYCLPERNLELPATLCAHALERLVGGEHYRNYRFFMRAGGLEGFVRAHPQSLHVHHRSAVMGGALAVLEIGLA